MDTRRKTEDGPRVLDKAELRRAAEELHERLGFEPDPTATVERLQQRMKDEGIRPEDNSATRALYQMRYGDNWSSNWPED